MFQKTEPLENLVDQFARFPGIGRKSAVRMAYQVMSMPAEQAPERMISAFSMITTLSEGSSFAASVATKHPALPPPMIRMSLCPFMTPTRKTRAVRAGS